MNAKAKKQSHTTNAYFFTHKSTNAKAKKRVIQQIHKFSLIRARMERKADQHSKKPYKLQLVTKPIRLGPPT